MQKLVTTFILLSAALLPNLSFAQVANTDDQCAKLIGTCDYYSCRESVHGCGDKGYYVGFGHRYCASSEELKPSLTPAGQAWINGVVQCLQQEVEDRIPTEASCPDVKHLAISGHAACYLKQGFCELSTLDQARILFSIRRAITESGVLAEGIQVLESCL